MYCFRCGQELPPRVPNCPVCDTPQKRRLRKRHRLMVGLLIFLSGAFVGSLLDSYVFQGKTLKHTFFSTPVAEESNPQPVTAWKSDPKKTVPGKPDSSSTSQPSPTPTAGNNFSAMKPPAEPVIIPSTPSETATIPEIIAKPDPTLIASAISSINTPTVVEPPASVSGAAPSASQASIPADLPLAPEDLLTPKSNWSSDYTLSFEKAESLEETNGVNYHGSLSPDSKLLIFSSNREGEEGKAKFQCYVKEIDNKTAQATKLFPWEGNVWTPEFSAGGQFLVFSSDSVKDEHIFLREATSQTVKQITDGKSKNMMPAISPDGRFIVFSSNRKGNNDIWMIGTDGKSLSQVTSGPEDDREPRWMPNGRAIVFTRILQRNRISNIMKVSLEPIEPPEKLAGENFRAWLPDASPDGKYLSYVKSESEDGSNNVIIVRRIDTGEEFQVKPFKGAEHYRPIWSPDGTGLVFHSDRKKNKHLFLAKFRRAPK